MPTIRDVANHTGLSSATISRVINNHPYVTVETKQHVHKAMKELGYFPNNSAQRLRNQKTDTLAVLIPKLSNPFFVHLLEGMERVATENNLQLLICQTKGDPVKELNYFQLLKTKQVDGLIMTSYENHWDTLTSYVSCGPVVLCNEFHGDPGTPLVFIDHAGGTYTGVRHLVERGHRKIAYCKGDKSFGIEAERLKGFHRAMKEKGIRDDEVWTFSGIEHSIEEGREILLRLLEIPQENRPTAIFTGSDEFAAGLVKEARSQGLKIPEDLAVIGFDDQPIAKMVEPELTTIRQPIEELGTRAIQLMVQTIQNKSRRLHQKIKLPYELVVRNST